MLPAVQARKLTQVLIDRGLVEKFVLDQTLVKLRPKETLADRLVSDCAITEADLLRAVAQSTGTKFISSPRLADLRLSAEVLGMIPLAASQELDVLPLAYNAAQKSLTVVIADPERLGKLDELPRVGKMDVVIANVAMPSAIRAAVRRLHGLDKLPEPAINIRPAGKCPGCREPYFDDQLECDRCGLLLNANAPTDNTEASIVRALLSQPSGLHRVHSLAQVHDAPTRVGFAVEVHDDHTPEVAASLEIARSLSEFEAFMVSFIDGRMTVGQLSEASGLQAIEVRSVISSLTDRRVVRLREPPPPPPAIPLNTPPVPRPDGLKARPRPPPPIVKQESPRASPGPLQPRHLSSQAQLENSLQAALALERRGEIDGAISVLRTAISRSPNPAPLYNRLALVVLNQRKDTREAEALLQKAIELEPENAVFQTNLIKVIEYAAVKKR